MEEVVEKCVELIEESQVAILSTIDSRGFPDTRAVFNLRCREKFPKQIKNFKKYSRSLAAFFTTNNSSGKMAQIRENNCVSVYFCNAWNSFGVMILGTIDIIEDKRLKNEFWQDDWVQYYPGGKNDEDYVLLKFNPQSAKGWNSDRTFNLSEADLT